MGLGRLQAWMLGLPTAVVYGSLALFISILHNVFLLYYVDTFVSVYKINKAAFWVGEASPTSLPTSTTSTSCPCASAGVSTLWCGGCSCSSWA